MIGCDVRSMDSSTLELLSNKEVIAVNQGKNISLCLFTNKLVSLVNIITDKEGLI